MPYYCTVPRCTSMAGKAKNVSFHQFPRDEELALLWNKILKRGKPYTKYSKVCSLHFRPEDYTITSVGKNKGQWRTLRKDAIPSRNLPSESPLPSPRRNSGSWVVPPSVPGAIVDARVQQHMAQAIYMQTMMAMAASNGSPLPTNSNMDCNDPTVPHSSRLPLPELEQLMKQSDSMQEYHRSQDFLNQDKNTSYKCDDCSKCFKDPDVFTLHRRSHNKTNTPERLTENISNFYEKENFNANSDLTKQETLRANPILANLLKSGITNPNDVCNANIFDTNNILSIENQIMKTLASNVESYIRNLTTILNHEGKDDKDDVVKAHDEIPSHSDDGNNGGDDRKPAVEDFDSKVCANSINEEATTKEDCEYGEDSKFFSSVKNNHLETVDDFNSEVLANSIKEDAIINEDCELSEDIKIFSADKNNHLETESWEMRDQLNDCHDFIKKGTESSNNDNYASFYQDHANEVSDRINENLNFESHNNESHNNSNEYKHSIKEDNDSKNEEVCYENVEKHETESRMHIVLRRESENEELNDSKDSNNLVIDECA